MKISGNDHASRFLMHYLDGRGADLYWNSEDAYMDDRAFRGRVDDEFRAYWNQAEAQGRSTFDSGYSLDYEFSHGGMGFGTYDYYGALKHVYYSIAGGIEIGSNPKNPRVDVGLRITSLYEFRAGQNFTIPLFGTTYGADYDRLAKVGLATRFRSIGTSTLVYFPNSTPGWNRPWPDPDSNPFGNSNPFG
jgi:hypothetical protein